MIIRYFNTSHVTVYRPPPRQPLQYRAISLHLMLLFINGTMILGYSHLLISIHLMLLFIFQIVVAQHREAYFNTSHVTVYQWDSGKSEAGV